jgi:hypothetical protein
VRAVVRPSNLAGGLELRNLLHPNILDERLNTTVPSLESMTAGLDLRGWQFRPAPGEWSVTEIVCHLRDVDREVHLPRLQSLLVQEEPFMPGVVSDDWAVEREYQSQDGRQALAELSVARAKLLTLLPPAEDPAWERRGRHTFFGPTSFWELVCLILEHDELHVEQVKSNLAALALS